LPIYSYCLGGIYFFVRAASFICARSLGEGVHELLRGDALPAGKIVGHSDKILWHIEGEGTACERRLPESRLADVPCERLEFGTVVGLDVIDDWFGLPSFAPAAHDAP
jgi:hypothetical protein